MAYIFTFSNIISAISLVFVNFLLLIISKRKRKYGLMPGILFLLVFISFLGGLAYQLSNNNNFLQRRIPNEVVLETANERAKTSADMKRKLYIGNYRPAEDNLDIFLRLTLRCSTIQAMFAFLLSFFGLISVNNRNAFYYQMLVVFLIAIILCFITESSIL